MTDTKPTQVMSDNMERANRCTEEIADRLSGDSNSSEAWDSIAIGLAGEFQASDAIARRRALEEAIEVCEREARACTKNAEGSRGMRGHWRAHQMTAQQSELCARGIRALLRAPTSEQTSEDARPGEAEGPVCRVLPTHDQPARPAAFYRLDPGRGSEEPGTYFAPAPLSPEEQEKRKPLPGRLVGSMPIEATSEKAEEK